MPKLYQNLLLLVCWLLFLDLGSAQSEIKKKVFNKFDLLCRPLHQRSTFTRNLVTIGKLDNALLLISHYNGSFRVFELPTDSATHESLHIDRRAKVTDFRYKWPRLYFNEELRIDVWERNFFSMGTSRSMIPFMIQEDRESRGKTNRFLLITLHDFILHNNSLSMDRFLYNLEQQGKPMKVINNTVFGDLDNPLNMTRVEVLSPLGSLSSDEKNFFYATGLQLLNETITFVMARLNGSTGVSAPRGPLPDPPLVEQLIPRSVMSFLDSMNDLAGRPFAARFGFTNFGDPLSDTQLMNLRKVCLHREKMQVDFRDNRTLCDTPNVEQMKGFHADKRFYLFGKDGVFSFDDAAFFQANATAAVTLKRYSEWIKCTDASTVPGTDLLDKSVKPFGLSLGGNKFPHKPLENFHEPHFNSHKFSGGKLPKSPKFRAK